MSMVEVTLERLARQNEGIIDELRYIRGEQAEMREDVREIKSRLGSLEAQYASLSVRINRLDLRLQRVERRLDLAAIPPDAKVQRERAASIARDEPARGVAWGHRQGDRRLRTGAAGPSR